MVHLFALNINHASSHLIQPLMDWLKFMKDKGCQPLLLSAPEEDALTFIYKAFFSKELNTLKRNQQAYLSRPYLPMPVLHVISKSHHVIRTQGNKNYVLLDTVDPITAVQTWPNEWLPDYWLCSNTFDYSQLRLHGIDNAICTPLLRHTLLPEAREPQGWLSHCFSIWVEGLVDNFTEQFLSKVIQRLGKIIAEITVCLPEGCYTKTLHTLDGIQVLYVKEQELEFISECHLALYLPGSHPDTNHLLPTQALAQNLPVIVPFNSPYLDFIGEHGCPYNSLDMNVAETEVVQWLLRLNDWRVNSPFPKKIEKFLSDTQPYSVFKQLANLMEGWQPDKKLQEKWLLSTAIHAQQAGDFSLALTLYQQLFDDKDQRINAYINSANLLLDTGNYEQACEYFKRLLEITPDHIGGLIGLGNTYRRMGQIEYATPLLEKAVTLEPKAKNHWNLAFHYLCLEEYHKAWPHFEYRHEALKLRQVDPECVQRWDPIQHKTGSLLILDEQGIGDTLQFMRFIHTLNQTSDLQICFAGKPSTLPVIKAFLPEEQVFDWNKTKTFSKFDYWVPLMSLPMEMGINDVNHIPPPSLAPQVWYSDTLDATWRNVIRKDSNKLTVALCWRGNPDFKADKTRSPGLEPMLPLLDINGINYVSLQINNLAIEEIFALGVEQKIQDIGSLIKHRAGDLLDTFSLLKQCDYVVTSCTSMAHMAGVLNIPTFVLLPQNSDWRWLTERNDSPWYPSISLIRQTTIGEWDDSIKTLQVALQRALQDHMKTSAHDK